MVFVKTGLEGLAFAASVAANIIGFGLLILLSRRVKNIFTKDLFTSAVKSIISAVVMCAAVIFVKNALPFANKYLQLFVPAVSGAVVYVVMCVILKSEEFFGILKTVMRKFLKEA